VLTENDHRPDNIWPAADSALRAAKSPGRKATSGCAPTRNIFSGCHFFSVPIDFYSRGLAHTLKLSAALRYVTFCRLANYHSSPEIIVSLKELEELDGVSPRSARLAHCKLHEYGLIHVSKTKPTTYRVETEPANWNVEIFSKPVLKKSSRVTIMR
jgi:hypothetical protein